MKWSRFLLKFFTSSPYCESCRTQGPDNPLERQSERMEPLLICEKFISRFKFWLDGQVQDGMQHRNELFRCLHIENIGALLGRQKIYDLSWALSHREVHTIITVSKEHYTLWVNLRSLAKLESAFNLINAQVLNNQDLTYQDLAYSCIS